MKKKPCKDYKVGDKGRMIFLSPTWITEIDEENITIKDGKGNTKKMPVWQFEKHWEPIND